MCVYTNEMKQKASDEKNEKNGEKMSARMKIKTKQEKKITSSTRTSEYVRPHEHNKYKRAIDCWYAYAQVLKQLILALDAFV